MSNKREDLKARPRSRRARQAGFSLIEVALALAVLAFGLGGIVDLYTSSEYSAGLAHRRMAAEVLASRKAEELKAAGLNALREYVASHAKADKPSQADYPPGGPAEIDLLGSGGADGRNAAQWRAQLELVTGPSGNVPYVRVVSLVKWGAGSGQRSLERRVYVFE